MIGPSLVTSYFHVQMSIRRNMIPKLEIFQVSMQIFMDYVNDILLWFNGLCLQSIVGFFFLPFPFL